MVSAGGGEETAHISFLNSMKWNQFSIFTGHVQVLHKIRSLCMCFIPAFSRLSRQLDLKSSVSAVRKP